MENFLAEENNTTSEIQSIIKEIHAKADGNVEVNVSYDIIRHVSAQLYTNPRKAIEELICNSYDAGAKVCYVTLPRDSKRSLLVLDNGKSMDLEGLQKLWKVADSPKTSTSDDRIHGSRMQIGKFGVGKLAAFALGKRLTHIVCINGEVRVVSVGQMEIKEQEGGKPPTFVVYKMPLNQAISSLKSFFSYLPKPWEKGWKTWTLAVVQDIDTSAAGRALAQYS